MNQQDMKQRFASWLSAVWYRNTPPPAWMRVLEVPYRAWVGRRGGRPETVPPVPVIVVGNLTAGGAGKTPLVIHLVELLIRHGFRPGVISRGYGGHSNKTTLQVDGQVHAGLAGDEPCLIHARTSCPVWVDRRRRRALQTAVASGVDVVISDDGLQHRALPRTLEICVVDGRRRFGNGHLLPAGPLREPVTRLDSVDRVVCKEPVGAGLPGEHVMRLQATALRRLSDDRTFPADHLAGEEVHAVAGIAFPEPFFELLTELGCKVNAHPFADHHVFSQSELNALPGPVVMTEKDAVRLLQTQSREDCWALQVTANLPEAFDMTILENLDL